MKAKPDELNREYFYNYMNAHPELSGDHLYKSFIFHGFFNKKRYLSKWATRNKTWIESLKRTA